MRIYFDAKKQTDYFFTGVSITVVEYTDNWIIMSCYKLLTSKGLKNHNYV